MEVQNLNLENLNSELLNSFKENGSINNISIPSQFETIALDFNNRVVNFKNTNDIIKFCEYLLITHEDITQFIVNNSIPSFNNFDISSEYVNFYNLPDFFNKGFDNSNENLIVICEFGMKKWLQFAIENKCELYPSLLTSCIYFNNTDCLEYLFENNCPYESNLCEDACYYGVLDCLKLLVKKGFAVSFYSLIFSIEEENYDCVEYIINYDHYRPTKIEKEMCINISAEFGYLKILKFLHKKGFEITETSCYRATEYNHIDCLKFIHENHPTFYRSELEFAYTYGFENKIKCECLEYLVHSKCPNWESYVKYI